MSFQIADQKELDRTYEQMLKEVLQEDFAVVHYLLVASGEKASL